MLCMYVVTSVIVMIFSSKQNITFGHGLIYRAKFSKYAKVHENPLQSDEKFKKRTPNRARNYCSQTCKM